MSLRRVASPVVIMGLVAAFLAISPVAGCLVRCRASAPPSLTTVAATDLAAAQDLWRGFHLEGEGLLDEAAVHYARALAATGSDVRVAATDGLARIQRVRVALGPGFAVTTGLSAISLQARGPVLAASAALLVTWLLRRSFRRRGTLVTVFPVYGAVGPDEPAAFRDALLLFSNGIKRAYGSDYARRLGMQLFFDDLTGAPAGDAGSMERALAETREFDTKAAVGFALRQSMLYLRDLTERARFQIGGSVRVFPGTATATAIVRDLQTGEDVRIEASLAELVAMPMYTFVEQTLLQSRPILPYPMRAPDAEDRRQVSRHLQALALVLASKIRWRQSQAVAVGHRPVRWETVCLFTAAVRDLA
jgi:hypothetical protein